MFLKSLTTEKKCDILTSERYLLWAVRRQFACGESQGEPHQMVQLLFVRWLFENWFYRSRKGSASENLKALLEVSDTLMIGTPDGEIKAIRDCITDILSEAKRNIKISEKLMVICVCHFSGSLSSDVFFKREKFGIKACSLHPMYPFSSKSTFYEKLNKAVFNVEGDDPA